MFVTLFKTSTISKIKSGCGRFKIYDRAKIPYFSVLSLLQFCKHIQRAHIITFHEKFKTPTVAQNLWYGLLTCRTCRCDSISNEFLVQTDKTVCVQDVRIALSQRSLIFCQDSSVGRPAYSWCTAKKTS